MNLNYRSDINPRTEAPERVRALFYAICKECDKAKVELHPEYQSAMEVFASVLLRIENARKQLREGAGEHSAATLTLFENFVLAMGMAQSFHLDLSALSNLILLTDEEAVRMQEELWALVNNNQKAH